MVLRGEGRAFCAGIDLGMPEDRVTGRSPAEKARNYYEGIRWAHERFKVFAELPKHVAVQKEHHEVTGDLALIGALLALLALAAASRWSAYP